MRKEGSSEVEEGEKEVEKEVREGAYSQSLILQMALTGTSGGRTMGGDWCQRE